MRSGLNEKPESRCPLESGGSALPDPSLRPVVFKPPDRHGCAGGSAGVTRVRSLTGSSGLPFANERRTRPWQLSGSVSRRESLIGRNKHHKAHNPASPKD